MLSQTGILNSAAAVEIVDQSAVPSGQNAKTAFAFLCLFTFWSFGRPEDIFPALASLHLTFVLGACAGAVFLGALAFGRTRVRWSRELTLVLLLSGWFILGLPFAFWRGGSYEMLMGTWVKTVIAFFLLTQTLTSIGRIRKIIWTIVISELVATSASILLQGREGLKAGDRLIGVNEGMFGWNFLGIALSVTLPFIAVLYISHRSVVRTGLLMAAVGSAMWMLILTASRGGFLGVIFSIFLTWLFVLRGSTRGRAVGVVIALCLIVAVAGAPGVFWTRVQTIWDASKAPTHSEAEMADASTEMRKNLIQRGIMYTLRYPIFGVGIGNFPVINGSELQRADAWLGTHNTFLQISSEGGIPALVLFLLLMQTMFRHAKEVADESAGDPAGAEPRLMARAIRAGVVSFVFSAFFAHIGYEYFFYYLAGISAGLWTISREDTRKAQRSKGSQLVPLAPPSIKGSPRWC